MEMIKYVNGEIKDQIPSHMRQRTPDHPCGGTILIHLEDFAESFEDLIRLGKISPDNEATVHKFLYSEIAEGRGTRYWFCVYVAEQVSCRTFQSKR